MCTTTQTLVSRCAFYKLVSERVCSSGVTTNGESTLASNARSFQHSDWAPFCFTSFLDMVLMAYSSPVLDFLQPVHMFVFVCVFVVELRADVQRKHITHTFDGSKTTPPKDSQERKVCLPNR